MSPFVARSISGDPGPGLLVLVGVVSFALTAANITTVLLWRGYSHLDQYCVAVARHYQSDYFRLKIPTLMAGA